MKLQKKITVQTVDASKATPKPPPNGRLLQSHSVLSGSSRNKVGRPSLVPKRPASISPTTTRRIRQGPVCDQVAEQAIPVLVIVGAREESRIMTDMAGHSRYAGICLKRNTIHLRILLIDEVPFQRAISPTLGQLCRFRTDSEGSETRTEGSETRTRLVPRLGWPALRTNGVLQPQLARRPLNPLVFAERSAPLDAHPHAPNTSALSGAFTRSVQSTGRSTGQGDKMALIASSPCILAHRPLQRQCSARTTNPAPTAFRSMYRTTVNRCSSLCTGKLLNLSLIQMTVPDGPVREQKRGRS